MGTTEMQQPKRKYIFTQLSAPIVGLSATFLLCAILMKTGILIPTSHITIVQIFLFALVIVFALVGAMVLWEKVIVVLGILSKDEAKGYPYSRPWEKSEIERDIDHLANE